jgi:hypothetical protein
VRRSWSSSGDKGHVAGEAGGLERRRRREIILTLARVKGGKGYALACFFSRGSSIWPLILACSVLHGQANLLGNGKRAQMSILLPLPLF